MSAEELRFIATDSPSGSDLASVDAGLESHNHSAAPLAAVRPLAVFAKGSSGQVVGGAVGRTWGACCELLQLWVDEEHRSAGVGSRLLHEFETSARVRACNVFYLTTLSYQAPEFYRRHRYDVIARIDGYPDGIVKYLMHRREA